jgi:hypothetical protein
MGSEILFYPGSSWAKDLLKNSRTLMGKQFYGNVKGNLDYVLQTKGEIITKFYRY